MKGAVTVSICFLLIGLPAYADQEENVVNMWMDAALRGVRDSRLPAPEASRALAIVSTCMYDAWTAFDDKAEGTQLKDILRTPASEHTVALDSSI
jgi:hypothetical protein